MILNYLSFIKVLLQHGADPGIRNTDGKTPLDVAESSCKSVLNGLFFILAITKKISNIRKMLSTSDSLLIAFEYHEFATLEAFPHIIYLLNFATCNKQVAGSPQQYTPITVGL